MHTRTRRPSHPKQLPPFARRFCSSPPPPSAQPIVFTSGKPGDVPKRIDMRITAINPEEDTVQVCKIAQLRKRSLTTRGLVSNRRWGERDMHTKCTAY